MKLIRIMGKTAFVFLAVTYAVCLMNGITVIEYTAIDGSGTLIVAGKAIEVHNAVADAFLKTYTQAETQAAEWLPSKLKSAVSRISDIFNCGK